MKEIKIPIKGFIGQLFCKHDFRAFEKPIDRKTNPRGFMSLNGPEIIYVCIKCGKEEK